MKITMLNQHQSVLTHNEMYRPGDRIDLPDRNARALIERGDAAAGWRVKNAPAAMPDVPAIVPTHWVENHLVRLRLPELQEIARTSGIATYGKRKAELVAAILEAQGD